MTEEEAYAQVASELANRDLRAGLWTKAMADSLGNENVAKSLYLKFRAEQILAESRVSEAQQRKEKARDERLITVAIWKVVVVKSLFIIVGAPFLCLLILADCTLVVRGLMVLIGATLGYGLYKLLRQVEEDERTIYSDLQKRRPR